MPLPENFDALFAATYQQEGLPELLPGEKAQELLSRLDRTLEKLDAVSVSDVVEEADDLHERFQRMFRFYQAAEAFASSDFLSKLHSESERQAVFDLIDNLRRVREKVAAAAEVKAQAVSEAAEAISNAILEQIERDHQASEAGRVIADVLREQHMYEVQEGVTDEDFEDIYTEAQPMSGLADWQREVPVSGYPTFDEFIADDDDALPEVLAEIDDDEDFDDEDYDQYDDDEDDEPYVEEAPRFEALFGINYEQTSLINRLPEGRLQEILEGVDAGLEKLNLAGQRPELADGLDPWAKAWENFGELSSEEELAAGTERMRQFDKLLETYKLIKTFATSDDLRVLHTPDDLFAAQQLFSALTRFRRALVEHITAVESAPKVESADEEDGAEGNPDD